MEAKQRSSHQHTDLDLDSNIKLVIVLDIVTVKRENIGYLQW